MGGYGLRKEVRRRLDTFAAGWQDGFPTVGGASLSGR